MKIFYVKFCIRDEEGTASYKFVVLNHVTRQIMKTRTDIEFDTPVLITVDQMGSMFDPTLFTPEVAANIVSGSDRHSFEETPSLDDVVSGAPLFKTLVK